LNSPSLYAATRYRKRPNERSEIGWLFELHRRNFKEPQSVGNKRETARRKWSRRAILNSSRGDKTAIELFWVGVRDLPGNLTNTTKVLATILG
jgi:hypothetical protein